MNDLTIILIYKNSYVDKKENLLFSLEYYKNIFKESNIVIVEQDVKQTFSKSLFCYNNGLFNRSWAFNVGMNHSLTNKILFADIDCFMDFDECYKSYELLKTYDVVKPFDNFIQLDKTTSYNIKNNISSGIHYDSIIKVNIGAGILFANKQKILEIGSWPEEFEGWGGEDDVMSIKIKNKLMSLELSYNLFHLYHERTPSISSNGHEKYEFNRRQALEIVPSMTREQLDDYIEEGKIKNVGNINKYKD